MQLVKIIEFAANGRSLHQPRISTSQWPMLGQFHKQFRGMYPLLFKELGEGAMRKSTIFILYLTGNTLILLALYSHALYHESRAERLLYDNTALVEKYELTDLCLFTEASYTRHFSQADRHAPFQNSPPGLEHFPSGSFLIPPEKLRYGYGQMD